MKLPSFFTDTNSKLPRLLFLLIIIAAVPLTVYLAQQQQEIRQRAQEPTEKITKSSPNSYGYIIQFKDDPLTKSKQDIKTQQTILKSVHENAKSDILSRLRNKRLQAQDTKNIKFYPYIKNEFTTAFNGIAINIGPEDVETVKQSPYVKNVYKDLEVKALLNESIPMINADKVWQKNDGQGRSIKGKGINVAVLDTGADVTHPDLGATVIPERSFEDSTKNAVGNSDPRLIPGYAIDNNRMAYIAGKKIYIYNFDTKTTTTVNLLNDNLTPFKVAFQNDIVAYVASNMDDYYDSAAYYYYNLTTNEHKKIANDGDDNIFELFVTNKRIIWGSGFSVFTVYDTTTGKLDYLTIDPYAAQYTYFSIYASGDLVAFSAHYYTPCYYKTGVYNITTRTKQEFTNAPEIGPILDFKGDKILYAACTQDSQANAATFANAYYLYDTNAKTYIKLQNPNGSSKASIVEPESHATTWIILLYGYYFSGSIGDNVIYFNNSPNSTRFMAYDLSKHEYRQINLSLSGFQVKAAGKKMCFTSTDSHIYCHDYDTNGSYPPLTSIYNARVVDGHNFISNDTDILDDYGHGTHVAATIGGYSQGSTLLGVAPNVNLIAYKVLDAYGSGSFSTIIKAIDSAVQTRLDSDPNNNIDIISMSLGANCSPSYSTDCGPDDAVSQAIDNAVDTGIVAVIAAGNSGPDTGTIASPGVARKAITVGAVDKSKQIANFSSRGPVSWNGQTIIKPDIVAPGVSICAAEWFAYHIDKRCVDDRHIAINGTSMATPHVSGVAALIRQAYPQWTPAQIKTAIKNNAVNLGLDSNVQGSGLINALPIFSVPIPTLSPTSTPSPTPPTTPSPQPVRFMLKPTTINAQVNQDFTVSVSLENNTNYTISGVDAAIQFTPNVLELKSFTPSVAFSDKLINSINQANGTLRYVAVEPDITAKETLYNLGTLTFTKKQAGSGSVSFQNTQITAIGITQSIPTQNNDAGIYGISQEAITPSTVPSRPSPCDNIGDVDQDGLVSYADSMAVLRMVVARDPYKNPTDEQQRRADVDGAEGVTSVDALFIQRYVNGTDSTFKACALPTSVPTIPIPTNTPIAPTIPVNVIGDANGDRVVDILDYNIWRDEFIAVNALGGGFRSDFNHDGKVDLLDFNIWRNAFK